MNLTGCVTARDLSLFAYFVWLVVVVQALRCAPWRLLLSDSRRQQVFLGASVVLFLV